MSLDADLDTLYGVPPQQFTARRKELAAAAKKRGDAAAAATIAAARRPTAAAWVVNVLVRADPTAATRLGELTAHLRAAHAAMDGARIRELSGLQRTLIAELVRAALTAAEVADPTAALRDDVTNTLQAAVADPEVAARLGRLEKAEEWSGFGDFGVSTMVGAPRRTAAPEPEPVLVDAERLRELTRQRADAAAAQTRAEDAHTAAVAAVADRKAALVAARSRHEEALEQLRAAEHEVDTADAELAEARGVQTDAESVLARATSLLSEADSALESYPD